jgi:hypothetical protein
VNWTHRGCILADLVLLVWFFGRLRGDDSWHFWTAPIRRKVALYWLPAAVLILNLLWLQVPGPASKTVGSILAYYLGQYPKAPASFMERVGWGVSFQPIDLVICHPSAWGCRFLTVRNRIAAPRSKSPRCGSARCALLIWLGASCSPGTLTDADLTGADLTGANLTAAFPASANLTGANPDRRQPDRRQPDRRRPERRQPDRRQSERRQPERRQPERRQPERRRLARRREPNTDAVRQSVRHGYEAAGGPEPGETERRQVGPISSTLESSAP